MQNVLQPWKRQLRPESYRNRWRIWKQGELGYSCGAYVLLTAAYNLKAYTNVELKWLCMTGKVASTFLKSGLTKKHLVKLAPKVNLRASPVHRNTIAPTPNKLFAVCLEVEFQDPVGTSRESGPHWVLLIDETKTGFVVADSHPWNPYFWRLSRTELNDADAVKGCGAIAIQRST